MSYIKTIRKSVKSHQSLTVKIFFLAKNHGELVYSHGPLGAPVAITIANHILGHLDVQEEDYDSAIVYYYWGYLYSYPEEIYLDLLICLKVK